MIDSNVYKVNHNFQHQMYQQKNKKNGSFSVSFLVTLWPDLLTMFTRKAKKNNAIQEG